MTTAIEPWQVWWADFDPQVGHEQAGLRPAVVAGTAFACKIPNDLVFLVPCTTTASTMPFRPQLRSFAQRPTFALCDHLKSVSRQRLRRRSSVRLSAEDIEAMSFVLGRLVST